MIKNLNLHKFFDKLSKKASRRNLYENIERELKKLNSINCLNIGSGGDIEEIIKNNVQSYYSIDMDDSRKPDEVQDVCSENFTIKFKPNLVCIFEVLEHVENPFKAVDNIYSILKNSEICLASTPFNFPIHDEPADYFRYTEYGLKLIFKKFSNVKIIRRNGWLDSIFVNIMRLNKEDKIFTRLIGKIFIIIYWLLFPLIIILQNIFSSKRLTTGYFIVAKK